MLIIQFMSTKSIIARCESVFPPSGLNSKPLSIRAYIFDMENKSKSGKHLFLSGKNNINWKGGITINSSGYVLIRVHKNHHLANRNGYAYLHRLVAEQKLGRRLMKNEVIHHIDRDKQNNEPENIRITKSIFHHMVNHRIRENNLQMPDEMNTIISCACGCSKTFLKYDQEHRPRKYISGHNYKDTFKQFPK